jgi:hypothetical protein
MHARPAIFAAVALAAMAIVPARADTASADRQDEVRRNGAQVMPFSLDQTLHTFDRTESGGIQRVRVRADAADQVAMIRSHLRAIARSFSDRDFSAPAHIHGADMPGMAQMRAAGPGDLTVRYRDIDGGAEITYTGRTPQIVDAVHRWFDAQLSDHGRDAATSTAPPSLAVLAWLAGTWLMVDGDTRTEEFWTSPASDLMIGMSRSVRGSRTTSFEFMRIAARADGVFYIAQPRGRPPVEFPLQSWDGTTATFINPGTSDHLRRIVYRRDGDEAMSARIEGANDGREFAEDYRYRRPGERPAD